MEEIKNPITEKVIEEIQKLQSIMHIGFIDNVNEMHYGSLTKNLHNNTVEISKAITYNMSLKPEQIANQLFDRMMYNDFTNALMNIYG